MTIFISFHRWNGFRYANAAGTRALTLGFLSIGTMPGDMLLRLKVMREQLDRASRP